MNCKVCNADISHRRKGTIFCSKGCNQKAYNKKHGVEVQEEGERIESIESGYIKYSECAGKVMRKSYHDANDRLHNPDSAAMVHYNKLGEITAQFWFLNGKRQEEPDYKVTFTKEGVRRT